MVKGELFAFGSAAAALGGAYKLSEFLYKAKRLRDVGPSNAVYVRIIGRVRSDLDEVRRLLSVREVHDALEANPDKSKWVYGCMRDVRGALENITPHTERVGGDIEEGRRVGVRHRVYWLLSEKEKLENREKELAIAHASLTEVIGFLSGLEPMEPPKQKQDKKDKKDKKDDQSAHATTKDTHIDIDIRRDAPAKHTQHVEREVWVERGDRYYDDRGHRYYDDRGDPYTRDLDFERYDPADPRYQQHTTERFTQHDQYDRQYDRRPDDRHPDDRHYPRPPPAHSSAPLGRRPESFEDRVPERDSWMQSSARGYTHGPHPDHNNNNNNTLPPPEPYSDREIWLEERDDLRFDAYGNRLPDRFFRPEYASVPRPYKSRM